MEFKYNTKAKETGSYVIGACGFDSIPNDVGLVYVKQKFEGLSNVKNSILEINRELVKLFTSFQCLSIFCDAAMSWSQLI